MLGPYSLSKVLDNSRNKQLYHFNHSPCAIYKGHVPCIESEHFQTNHCFSRWFETGPITF